MVEYKHKVQYYETDGMGITHHSNYIRWMEEARIYALDLLGWGYDKFEKEGIASPTTEVECQYKQSTTFPDEVTIEVAVREFKGIRLKLCYRMFKEDGSLACKGNTECCFVNSSGRPVNMKAAYPEFYQLMQEHIADWK